MKRLFQIFVIGALVVVLTTLASAQVPQLINYQGKLTNATGAPVNDTVQMIFSIYSDTGGTNPLWTETQSAVVVEKGVFNVLLGSVDSIPSSVFDGSIRYLGVKVGDDPEITPRKPMVSVGYAFHSGTADTAKYSMPDADWVINGDNIYHLNGNVGIGTETPSGPLRIRRAIPLDGGGHLDLDRTEDITKQAYLSFSSGNHQDACIGLAPNKSDELNINAEKVGIGTTNPWSKLDVVTDENRPDIIQGSNPNTGADAGAGIFFHCDAGYNGGLFQASSNYNNTPGLPNGGAGMLILNTGATSNGIGLRTGIDSRPIVFVGGNETMRLVNGNVGIGTTSPGTKLNITNGTVGGTLYDFIRLGIANDATSYHQINASFNGATADQNRIVFNMLNGSNPRTDVLTLRGDGNVGIGTTSPAYKLDVNGDIRTTGTLSSSSVNSYSFSGQNINLSYMGEFPTVRFIHGSADYILQTGPDASFYLYDHNATAAPYRLFVRSDGDVGIGTTTPAYKLDVAGDIRSTGTIYGNFSGTIDNALHWNGHNWGDTYPYSSNSDLVDGIHGTQFLRNDQSGTLNGSLTVNGRVEGWASNSSEVIRAENSGSGQGIFARTHSTNGGSGVSGDGAATGASDNSFGVAGSTHSPSGEQPPTGSSAGVYGLAANTGVGDAFGVLGRCWTHGGSGNPTAAGVFGWGDVSSGSTYGVWGETGSTQNDVSGVYGTNTALTGATRGTIGAIASTTAGAAGVLGAAPNTGAVRGVMGYCHSASGYAMYSDGNFAVPNPWTKSVIMPVSKGAVKLYCLESPEVWFEDFGEGELNAGKAHVELDPLFLQTVTINAQYPMKVFVQLNDECNGVFVKRGTIGFDVTELNNGKSNAHFTYRIVAKRKGCETKRLEETELVPYEFTQPLSSTSTWKE